VLSAPNLGWRDLLLRDAIASAVGLPVEVENSGKACALAQLWSTRDAGASGNFVYLTVSDGLGVGIVLGGQLVRASTASLANSPHPPEPGRPALRLWCDGLLGGVRLEPGDALALFWARLARAADRRRCRRADD